MIFTNHFVRVMFYTVLHGLVDTAIVSSEMDPCLPKGNEQMVVGGD